MFSSCLFQQNGLHAYIWVLCWSEATTQSSCVLPVTFLSAISYSVSLSFFFFLEKGEFVFVVTYKYFKLTLAVPFRKQSINCAVCTTISSQKMPVYTLSLLANVKPSAGRSAVSQNTAFLTGKHIRSCGCGLCYPVTEFAWLNKRESGRDASQIVPFLIGNRLWSEWCI